MVKRILLTVLSLSLMGCDRCPKSDDEERPNRGFDGNRCAFSAGEALNGRRLHSKEKEMPVRIRAEERISDIALRVHEACIDPVKTNSVDSLVQEVMVILDEFESMETDGNDALDRRTNLVAPFVRTVEEYWIKRRFDKKEHPPGNLLEDIDRSYALSTRTVDLLYEKVGNFSRASSIDVNICATLKWLSHNLERAGWMDQKVHVDKLIDKWITTRYDVAERNPLKSACERFECFAAKSNKRESLHPAVRSRLQNMSMDKAVRVVGRLPKWAEGWRE